MARALFLLCALLLACEQAPSEAVDGPDDAFLGPDGKADVSGIEEGSAEACGVLRAANQGTLAELDDSPPGGAGLDRRAAGNIVAARDGDDGQGGTDDDEVFETLAELDAISYVGPVAFGRLLDYANARGFIEACSAQSTDDRFSFFVLGDSRARPAVLEAIAGSMITLDPGAIAAFNTGDITANGTYSQWTTHLEALAEGAPDPTVPEDPAGIIRQSRIRTDVDDFGPWIRYIGILGNHDQYNGEWFGAWNSFLPGQRELGYNESDGIYFSLRYGNTLFIALDSVNPSERQTRWLEALLESEEAQSATWIFPFLHHPVYPCNGKEPFHEGLEWVELFEQHGIELAFVAHSHTYERTCPMIGGRCAEGGVIYLNSSAAGAPVRTISPERELTVEDDGRTDQVSCGEILEAGRGDWDHFCHVQINGCRLRLSCFDHDWVEGDPPYDMLVLDHCQR